MDTDGSMTDRWMGVFRSVDHEPIGDARYARVQGHQRYSAIMTLVGLVLVAGPAILTVVAVVSDSTRLVGFAVLAWIVGPVVGVGPLHTGFKRLRHLRGIHPVGEVEVFVGTAPMSADAAAQRPVLDSTTRRLMTADVIATGRTHRLIVHPETGLLLEVDGVLVSDFVGGDVTITARIPRASTQDPASTTRPLSVLEKHELRLLSHRLTRGTWGPVLGVASAATAVGFLVWTVTSDRGPDPDVVSAILTVGGSLLLVAAVDGWHRRRLRATLQRDSEAGLRRVDHGWLLPESGICWESNGLPGPLRLSKGGLGSEADGRTQPVMF
jgi:uncharacterized membrane protein YgdD (TMEM256/DUF423 family)